MATGRAVPTGNSLLLFVDRDWRQSPRLPVDDAHRDASTGARSTCDLPVSPLNRRRRLFARKIERVRSVCCCGVTLVRLSFVVVTYSNFSLYNDVTTV